VERQIGTSGENADTTTASSTALAISKTPPAHISGTNDSSGSGTSEKRITTEGEVLSPEDPLVRLIHLMWPPDWLERALKGFEEHIKIPPSRPPKILFRIPRSKKRRIWKKWLQNPKNYRMTVYILGRSFKDIEKRKRRKREREEARGVYRDEERNDRQSKSRTRRIPHLLKEFGFHSFPSW
jgi:hypothetical protein